MIDHRSYKLIIGGSFCDIQKNQGRGKGYQPQPSVSADKPYLASTLIILDIPITESNNCFIIHGTKEMEVMFLSPLTQSAQTCMITRGLECP